MTNLSGNIVVLLGWVVGGINALVSNTGEGFLSKLIGKNLFHLVTYKNPYWLQFVMLFLEPFQECR